MVTSLKSELWWVLWVRVCLWFVCAPKCSNHALTNLMFSLCRSVWVIDLLVNLSNPHPGTPTHPSTLEVLWVKERTSTPSPSVIFTFGLAVESIKELGGASYDIWRYGSMLMKNVNVDVNVFGNQCNTIGIYKGVWPSYNVTWKIYKTLKI